MTCLSVWLIWISDTYTLLHFVLPPSASWPALSPSTGLCECVAASDMSKLTVASLSIHSTNRN